MCLLCFSPKFLPLDRRCLKTMTADIALTLCMDRLSISAIFLKSKLFSVLIWYWHHWQCYVTTMKKLVTMFKKLLLKSDVISFTRERYTYVAFRMMPSRNEPENYLYTDQMLNHYVWSSYINYNKWLKSTDSKLAFQFISQCTNFIILIKKIF